MSWLWTLNAMECLASVYVLAWKIISFTYCKKFGFLRGTNWLGLHHHQIQTKSYKQLFICLWWTCVSSHQFQTFRIWTENLILFSVNALIVVILIKCFCKIHLFAPELILFTGQNSCAHLLKHLCSVLQKYPQKLKSRTFFVFYLNLQTSLSVEHLKCSINVQ